MTLAIAVLIFSGLLPFTSGVLYTVYYNTQDCQNGTDYLQYTFIGDADPGCLPNTTIGVCSNGIYTICSPDQQSYLSKAANFVFERHQTTIDCGGQNNLFSILSFNTPAADGSTCYASDGESFKIISGGSCELQTFADEACTNEVSDLKVRNGKCKKSDTYTGSYLMTCGSVASWSVSWMLVLALVFLVFI
eukprot:TRINITY_DN1390_c0_g1_i2.p1 TRINITY_DN1390_c0_g1~~TRINITY_DN1390_c0_g1_i2.p1  ORF type:complete len:191 (+),score=7.32 TRINITY_DN1390_c0_g1_i2:2-574(+)